MTLKRAKVYKRGNNIKYSTTVNCYLIWQMSVFSPSIDTLRVCCASDVKIVIQDYAPRRETFLGTAGDRLSANYVSDNELSDFTCLTLCNFDKDYMPLSSGRGGN